LEIVEVPAKIFLIGEYLVLEGGDAVLEAIRPGYRFEIGDGVDGSMPHSESPAGQLLFEARARVARFRLLGDSAPPGYGGSTAECLMAWKQVHGVWPDPEEIHLWYRRKVPFASGADLLLQAMKIGSPRTQSNPFVYERMVLLERITPSKRPTHEDLALDRPPIRFEVLSSLVERFRKLLSDPVEGGFRLLGEYAEELSRTGRETDNARQIREFLQTVDGVEGVKGCGAGLHDQFLMVLKPGVSRASVAVAVEQAGLRIRGSLSECVW
jgi:hypothetical protein